LVTNISWALSTGRRYQPVKAIALSLWCVDQALEDLAAAERLGLEATNKMQRQRTGSHPSRAHVQAKNSTCSRAAQQSTSSSSTTPQGEGGYRGNYKGPGSISSPNEFVHSMMHKEAAAAAVCSSRPSSTGSVSSRSSGGGRLDMPALTAKPKPASAVEGKLAEVDYTLPQWTRQPGGSRGEQGLAHVTMGQGLMGRERLENGKGWQVPASAYGTETRVRKGAPGVLCRTSKGEDNGLFAGKAAAAADHEEMTSGMQTGASREAGPYRDGASLDEDWETVLQRYRITE
jgi:hypothetical protein